ncbi:metal-dependent transcriptional regulator [Millisia brevis]|uniref:metal-dependent transcriptional regulator n=1 Tax=Millisia brevis TaxID=264148 RepID=UPI00082955AA|nr:metal-dependent transcriptional regulator [Millisia brevis]
MDKLVDTVDTFLKVVLECRESGVAPLRARLAERANQSGASASGTVGRMTRDGLLDPAGGKHLSLTPAGLRRAISVLRKHRLAECLLADVIGLDWIEVHAEASQWEHVIGDSAAARLTDVLGNPTHSPYGNPIPKPGAVRWPPRNPPGAATLLDLAATATSPTSGRILWITERAQCDAATLGTLFHRGVLPNATGTVEPCGPFVRFVLDSRSGAVDLPRAVAAQIVALPA